ncbi:olfactory receptor 51G2-like [Pleurodeles waltl]|uniref:olfactory receptor 51G2-like n=1 Tax=Pleurodeles waltl TaxID=8319 RepID=UPI003709444C
MAFDRYVAICKPLQYVSILHPIISKIGLVALMRCLCLHFAVPFLLKILPYCDKHVLSFAFCYHTDVMKLACADTTITSTYNLVVVITTYPVDAIFILLSYIMILRNILNRTQQSERLKALNTCVSHLCVVMLFYIPLISLSLASRYGQKDSVLLRVVLGGILLVVPPAMNPMIYSIKTKQIRSALRKRFWPTKQNN